MRRPAQSDRSAAGGIAELMGWSVTRPLAGGEFGALLIERRHQTAVFKAVPGEDRLASVELAANIVAALLSLGYPAPKYLDIGVHQGVTYTIQEHIDAFCPPVLSVAMAEMLVDLVAVHRLVTPSKPHRVRSHDGSSWGQQVLTAVTGKGATALPSIESSHTATGLLHEVRSISAVWPPIPVEDNEVSHQDFHHRNILAKGDRVVAVVDWDGARWGNADFDLFVMWFWASVSDDVAPSALRLLRRAVDDCVSADLQALYSAYLVYLYLDYFGRARPNELPMMAQLCEERLAPHWRPVA